MSNKFRSPLGNFTPFTSHFHPLSKPKTKYDRNSAKVDTQFTSMNGYIVFYGRSRARVDLKAICGTTI